MRTPRRPPTPLDPAQLDKLALRYVERFATSRRRLTDYLVRKIRERGWAGEAAADPAGVSERMAELGYVDDRAFADARASAMQRRGLGSRRVAQTLRADGIEEEDRDALTDDIAGRAGAAAVAFARRKRIGPFAAATPDRALREKQQAAMMRAGHAMPLIRRILAMPPGSDPDELVNDMDH